MLSFDWVEENSMVGINYLENLLDKSAMIRRLLSNLKEGIDIDSVLKNHLEYCAKNKIKESKSFAFLEIINSERDIDVREAALTCLYLGDDLSEIEKIVPKVQDDFKWCIIDSLIKHNSPHSGDILMGILENSNVDDERIKASMRLMELKNLAGLEFYVKWVEKNKAVPDTLLDRLQEKSPVVSVSSVEAIPYIMKRLGNQLR